MSTTVTINLQLAVNEAVQNLISHANRGSRIIPDSFDVQLSACATDDEGTTTTINYSVELLQDSGGTWHSQGIKEQTIIDNA